MENWKNDMDNDFKEFDYFAKKSAKRIVIGVIGVALVFGGIGIIGRKIDTEADRKIFKESTTYNESAAAFLAKSLKEYNQAETEDEKKAIMNYVVATYPNLDTSNLDNAQLQNFYNKCLEG